MQGLFYFYGLPFLLFYLINSCKTPITEQEQKGYENYRLWEYNYRFGKNYGY